MGRGAIIGGMAAALAVAAVALGAGADVRLHRLHVPPPPSTEAASGDVSLPAGPGPASPPEAPLPPAPPGAPPPPAAPPPAPAIGCTSTNAGAPADTTGTLIDEQLTLTVTTVSAAATLRIRGVNQGLEDHSIAIRPLGGAHICGTPTISHGTENTFAVTNLPAGTYQVYCTIHPTTMRQNLTVS